MFSIKSRKYRTHFCNEINYANVGEDITLSGWVHRKRDHGGLIFIDLRDHTAICQLVIVPEKRELFEIAEHVHHESVITVKGKVTKRSAETINHILQTGEFEILVNEFILENDSLPSPFPISDDIETSEELRLKYRFLDLRKSRLHDNIVFRSRLAAEIRKYLTKYGFIEIQTPILTSSSPEGARDFLVPSRIHPGHFYALPQAPQQFKQLLMVAGFDKYFQIAPCFRDEDARADRSPGEFYQLDLEMSFIEQNDLFVLIENMFDHVTNELSEKKIVTFPFPQITYRDAMNRFGTDKPDLRNPLEMIEVSDIFKMSTFKIFAENAKNGRTVKALVLKEHANESRLFYDKAEEKAKQLGLPGLAYIQFKDEGNKGPILKFMNENELNLLKSRLKIKTGDVVFFAAGIWERTCKIMGEMRSYFGGKLFEFGKNELAFCWIVDFPMYEYNEDLKKVDFSHNPFSMPQGGLQTLKEKNPLDILAFQYDIVCNGIELSSGAIRNHKPEVMYKAFEIAGYSKSDVDAKFGHMIRAFQHGAPPHGGIAPGFDRMVMIYRDEENLREVIPFPMNQKAQDLLMGAPSNVSEKQLDELHISVKLPIQKGIQKND